MIDAETFGELSQDKIASELPHIDPRLNTMLVQLNRTSATLIATFDAKARHSLGLTWSGYRLLFVLWVIGDVEPARAADLTHTSRASVSSLSSSFENRGLLTKRPSQEDGRSVLLSLTEEGHRLVRKAVEHQELVQRELLSDLSPAEQEVLTVLLNKIKRSRPLAVPPTS